MTPMLVDPLTDVLDALRLEPEALYQLNLAAPWGMSLSVSNGAAFTIVEEGQCWLRLPDQPDPLLLNQGDLIVIVNAAHYELLATLDSPVLPIRQLLTYRNADGIITRSAATSSAQTRLICSKFQAPSGGVSPLFTVLPPLIHIRDDHDKPIAWLTAPLQMLMLEEAHQPPGKAVVVSRLMDILFIMVIRAWLATQDGVQGGWWHALYHPQIGVVLRHIHRHPTQAWTVATLARTVSLSRSALAAQFTALVGQSPIQYLTRWRMQVAMMWLRQYPYLSLTEIAERVGYSSSYAFSKAFKRLVGVSPKTYRLAVQSATSSN